MSRLTQEDPTNLSSKAGLGRDETRAEVTQPTLGFAGWVRWAWRQLTSMRVALLLLLLLALAALPGSFIPQQPQDAAAVEQYRADHPELAPWLERLGFFDVYASPWFAAVYLLLFTSLIGCILPRIKVHWRALRAQPPRVPRNFARFPVRDERMVPAAPEVVEARVLAALKGRYRAAVTDDGITAERGYLRESGNLLFHVSLVGILLSMAAGQLYSYRGQAIVIEGDSFANSVVDYDTFTPGSFFDPADLEPFTFTLDDFTSEFTVEGVSRDFAAHVTVAEPDGSQRSEVIRVNQPMKAGGANVYLQGNGYAPHVTVRDRTGQIAFSGPVPFLPEDFTYTSRGVIKVPDVSPGLEQLGFTGYLLPTAVIGPDGDAVGSAHPQPANPLLILEVWAGNLGLDEGIPQNVYELDTSAMEEVLVPGTEEQLQIMLAPGETVELPDGTGSITFEAMPRFAALDLRYDPSLPYLLASALAAMAGLSASLLVPRRRLWLRLTLTEGGTTVAGAALARGEDHGLAKDLGRVLDAASTPTTSTTGPADRAAEGA